MKLLKQPILSIILLLVFGCSDEQISTQEQEAKYLEELLSEIEALASSVECENPEEWTFTSVGNKPCGGPSGFIAYSLNIDTETFLQKVEEHKVAQEAFNKKWGLFSDCSIPPTPKGVICENGEAILVFGDE
ncbi:hypothetical protein [Roseivirga pacifica]|nr:hypothetical protein [Roseivirga pacifica]